jgi:hypothetical protein
MFMYSETTNENDSKNDRGSGEEPNLGIAGELGRKLEATGCCEPTLF